MIKKALGAALLLSVLSPALAVPALADLKLCNNTQNRVGVALGYKDAKGWASEGWWNIGPNACETLLKGSLIARFYYIYAVDYDKGGAWGGKAVMCTRDKIFTIRGDQGLQGTRLSKNWVLRSRYERGNRLDDFAIG